MLNSNVAKNSTKNGKPTEAQIGKLFMLVSTERNLNHYNNWKSFHCVTENNDRSISIVSRHDVLMFLGYGKSHGRRFKTANNSSHLEHLFLTTKGELRLIFDPLDFYQIFKPAMVNGPKLSNPDIT